MVAGEGVGHGGDGHAPTAPAIRGAARGARSPHRASSGASRNGTATQSRSRSLCRTLPRLPRSPASTSRQTQATARRAGGGACGEGARRTARHADDLDRGDRCRGRHVRRASRARRRDRRARPVSRPAAGTGRERSGAPMRTREAEVHDEQPGPGLGSEEDVARAGRGAWSRAVLRRCSVRPRRAPPRRSTSRVAVHETPADAAGAELGRSSGCSRRTASSRRRADRRAVRWPVLPHLAEPPPGQPVAQRGGRRAAPPASCRRRPRPRAPSPTAPPGGPR